jgi:nicotinamide/nicotinate riboside kinase
VETRIPYTTTRSGSRIQDWDTVSAIDTTFLSQSLSYVRTHGHLPPRLQSKEDQNEKGASGVPDEVVSELRDRVAEKLASSSSSLQRTIVFMEGFLLYAPPSTDHVLRKVHEQIALPLFLPASYENVKRRREGRSGYVTIGPAPEEPKEKDVKEGGEVDLEGEDDRPPQNFWVDPPGYVDDVVWPRYVEDHAWLLVEEGEGDLPHGLNVRRDVGVKVVPGGEVDMETMLRWAVKEVLGAYTSE